MISNRRELKEWLTYEKKLYFSSFQSYLVGAVSKSANYYIYRYILHLRKAEYHMTYSALSLYHKFCKALHLCLKNRLGITLGFQISAGCFGKGLKIYHPGCVVVNSQAQIGNDCQIMGNICIGSKGPGPAPHIGNGVIIGWGAVILGDIQIEDNIYIGAGSVVRSSFLVPETKIAGVPAKEIL